MFAVPVNVLKKLNLEKIKNLSHLNVSYAEKSHPKEKAAKDSLDFVL